MARQAGWFRAGCFPRSELILKLESNMRRAVLAIYLLAGSIVLAPAAVAWGQQFDDLVSRIPDGANTLMLLNVDKILSSPVAVREDCARSTNRLMPRDCRSFRRMRSKRCLPPTWLSTP